VTTRHALNVIVGGVILGAIAYFSYIFLSAENRVREACAEVKPGMTLAGLRAFAELHGMRKPTRDTGIDFLVETKTFGRFGCKVTLESGVVWKAEYNFAD
jgi:hypothetical protein